MGIFLTLRPLSQYVVRMNIQVPVIWSCVTNSKFYGHFIDVDAFKVSMWCVTRLVLCKLKIYEHLLTIVESSLFGTTGEKAQDITVTVGIYRPQNGPHFEVFSVVDILSSFLHTFPTLA